MPVRRAGQPQQPPPSSGGGVRRVGGSSSAPGGVRRVDATPTQPNPESGGITGTDLAIGGATMGGLALLAKAPGVVGKFARGLNSLRQQMMLSGFALPKSLLGNVGAVAEAAIESKSLRPLKEAFSGQTIKDAVSAYKAGGVGNGIRGVDEGIGQSGNVLTRAASHFAPGRFMGAADEAAQGVLRRSGMSSGEAQRATLQAPLDGRLASAMDSPAARYLHPFRRTPFNAFFEGLERLPTAKGGSTLGKSLYMGAGAAHGAATADDDRPLSLPFAVAASARYGLPYAAAAYIGRQLADGSGGGDIASQALPVGEYGWESSLSDPIKPFREPAALRALRRLVGER